MKPFRTTALVGALVAAAGAEFLIDGGETAGDAGYVAREKPACWGYSEQANAWARSTA